MVAVAVPIGTGLTPKEIEQCKKAFRTYDKNGSGSIDMSEFRSALIALGQNPSPKDLQRMMASVDEDNSKEIELPKLSGQFGEFLKVFATSKAAAGDFKVDRITAGAFVALGGNRDLTGSVSVLTLKDRLAHNFNLDIDLNAWLAELDKDSNGSVDFTEFSALFADDQPDPCAELHAYMAECKARRRKN